MKNKLKLRMWVKVVLVAIGVIIFLTICKKLDDDFMKGCMSEGYSRDYCIAHK